MTEYSDGSTQEPKMATTSESIDIHHQNGEKDEKEQDVAPPGRYLTGIRLILVCMSLCICTFLSTAEIVIVSTSLVTISADLESFERSNWIITTYLCAFTGFLLFWAKVGHHIGLKTALICSNIFFMAFSAGCGASQTIDQLIVFRALQGVGGAGLMALPSTVFFSIVPSSGYSKMNALYSVTLAVALVVSPLIGGSLSNDNDWRWIFYLNLPIGAVALIGITIALPNRFPHHVDPKPQNATKRSFISSAGRFLWEIDIIGAFLLLAAVVLLVAALEEGGTVHYGWDAPFIIASFVVSGVCLVALLLWQWWGSKETTSVVPSFPRSFTSSRVLPGALLGALFIGASMTISSITLPQRYQLVNKESPLNAGIKFLAYGVPFPVGVVISSILAGRLRLPFVYVILAGTVLQIVGFSLLSTTPDSVEHWPGHFGYSVITGLGVGITGGLVNFLAPLAADKKEQYLAIGAGLQMRMLGGSIGIAVVNSVWVNYVRQELVSTLSKEQTDILLGNIATLAFFPPEVQEEFRKITSDGYNLQMRATLGFVAAQIIAVAALWRRPAYRLSTEGKLV